MKQYALYVQDDWRVTDRLTLNLGLRYDLVDRLPDRSVEESELRDAAGGRRGRPVRQRHRLRGLRQERRRKTRTTSSRALGFASATCAATARTSSAPAGASTTTSATPTRTSCSPRSTRSGPGFGPVFHGDQHGRHPQPRRQPVSGRAAADEPDERDHEPGGHPAVRPGGLAAAAAAGHAADRARLVASAQRLDGASARLRPHRRQESRTSAPRSTRGRTADRAASPTWRFSPNTRQPAAGDQPRQEPVRRADPRRCAGG